MSDYISREAVLMQLCNRHCATDPAECLFKITHNGDPGCFTADDILKIPAADVRPVVYCKDCIHRPYSTEPGKTSGFAVEAPDRECKCPCFNPDDGYYSWIPADDFFCADGERREGGTP